MHPCKKFKSPQNFSAVHHAGTAGDCADCVYFSQKNCGLHGAAAFENAAETDVSLQSGGFI